MTKTHSVIIPMVAAALLSACAQTPMPPIETSRVDSAALYFHNDPINEGSVIEQMAALNQSADQLVRASTLNGALMGAALGCGLTVLRASNARHCVAGAVLGGAGGAVIGNAAGQRDVARRIELVSPNAVVRNLHNASAQFESIQADLPDLLAQQEAELNSLTMQLLDGRITQDEHDQSVMQIEQQRVDLAEALTLSARDARQASDNLKVAARRGQTGLDWHIGTASRLADDVESTRSTFSML